MRYSSDIRLASESALMKKEKFQGRERIWIKCGSTDLSLKIRTSTDQLQKKGLIFSLFNAILLLKTLNFRHKIRNAGRERVHYLNPLL